MNIQSMTPREIVSELDRYIIGQEAAKRAVAIAFRNRYRRMQLDDDMRKEITPKNILMIGPTGVGKTEIARRLALLSNAPFIKVEATKFTEVGYVGRDVESIIRDLVERAVKMVREQAMEKVNETARTAAEERILDILVPVKNEEAGQKESATRTLYRQKLQKGELDNKEIDIDISQAGLIGMEIMAPPGMEDMISQIQNMMQNVSSSSKKKKRLKVSVAMKSLQEEEAYNLINEDDIRLEALDAVEQNGIVFIDEIDKVVKSEGTNGQVSREGVQRDLLPLVEGCTVSTKYGSIKTDHILFIASGAFHLAKPSDLVPELQGRFPIRVEMASLSVDDLMRILTEPKASLTEQYTALLKTEGLQLKWNKAGVKRLAELAFEVNESMENIGARRLHTVLEKLLDQVSYAASDSKTKSLTVSAKYVNEQLASIVKDEDLSQYIL